MLTPLGAPQHLERPFCRGHPVAGRWRCRGAPADPIERRELRVVEVCEGRKRSHARL